MKRDFEDNSDEIDLDDGGQGKYYIYYRRQNDELKIGANYYHQVSGTLHTTNEKWLEQYISENETEIKKYLFGIEVIKIKEIDAYMKKYVGQKYRVIDDGLFEMGEIVELIRVEADGISLYRNSGGEEWFIQDADTYCPHVELYVPENETEIKKHCFGIEL